MQTIPRPGLMATTIIIIIIIIIIWWYLILNQGEDKCLHCLRVYLSLTSSALEDIDVGLMNENTSIDLIRLNE